MRYFPDENTEQFRKAPIEQELIEMLVREEIKLPAVNLTLITEATADAHGKDPRIDGVLNANWRGKDAAFVFEYRRANTPRAQEAARAIAQRNSELLDLPAMVILPYLSEEALQELDRNDISGIDLCGNGLLIAENFRYWRSGQPNRFKDTRPIRNPFHGDSSIFARCFLLRDHFSSLIELGQYAQERTFGPYPAMTSKALTQSTASKVVQTLIDELAIRKAGSELELQDRKRLLTLLRRGYRSTELPTVIGTSQLSPEKIWEILQEERTHGTLRAVTTGLASAGHYKALSGVGRLALYVSDLNAATTVLKIRAGRAFANIELHEDRKNAVYFDAREEGDKLWASPIQTWMELITGGPREQEAAEEMERMLLAKQGDHHR